MPKVMCEWGAFLKNVLPLVKSFVVHFIPARCRYFHHGCTPYLVNMVYKFWWIIFFFSFFIYFRNGKYINETTWMYFSTCLFCLFREQSQWPGQKNGEAVCRESGEETSRGHQYITREEGRGWGTHGEIHSAMGPQCIAFVYSISGLFNILFIKKQC